jgi:hypothetical protein
MIGPIAPLGLPVPMDEELYIQWLRFRAHRKSQLDSPSPPLGSGNTRQVTCAQINKGKG